MRQNLHILVEDACELRDLISHTGHGRIQCQLRDAACRGMDPDLFHPDDGQQPDNLVIIRCVGCSARLACLALALRAEDPGARAGWYGGLGPRDRDQLAVDLRLDAPRPPMPEEVARAANLKADGWTIEQIATALERSRRTIQRYLRMTAV